ncbi:small ligand-binding sensory domain FIST [Actinomycetospora succinea]|uniref:Small ligand-binding sensory domain FIST n=1 Tax=Actinomycetospora succinea TaxID=663603 RepID=A0A4R6V542_9PSEU|nr:FIST N-terminal domain-containing protein [Actinomycetospora succinea]TDQ54041.1 small ligand-binding sensory domain FIST [Actinomycetospora succinea]
MPDYGDGLAQGGDLLAAAENAVAQATAPLGGRRPDLLAVFVCHPDPDEIARAGERAMEVAGARVAVGCSAGGVIGDGRGVEAQPAVAVWAGALPDASLTPFRLDAHRAENGLVVGGMPKRTDADEVALLLADPYTFPIQGFVEHSAEALQGLPLVGGLASGPGGAGATRLFLDGVVHERGVVGVTIGGDVRVRTLVSQGCRPVGPTMTVTAAEGPHLQGLAGQPAYRKLEQIVGELDEAEQQMVAQSLHLGIAMDEYADDHRQGDFLIRGVVGADPEQGTVTVGDVVEVGRTVRFQVRDAASADADLDWLMTRHRGDGDTAGALLFSCNGRGRAMFPDADHDVAAVRRGLRPEGVAGFFAAGEIGPVAARNHLHAFTASVLAFGG